MSDNKYNGWTNYATWRVNLELIEGYEHNQTDVGDLAEELKYYVECIIDETTPDGIAKDYALAFISDVNYYEIASYLIESEE